MDEFVSPMVVFSDLAVVGASRCPPQNVIPYRTRAAMTQSQLFSISVRILGVYLLVEAVLQIPEGVVDSIAICWAWIRGDRSEIIAWAVLYPRLWSALLGFLLFTTSGVYLLRDAPHLFRLAGIPAAGPDE